MPTLRRSRLAARPLALLAAVTLLAASLSLAALARTGEISLAETGTQCQAGESCCPPTEARAVQPATMALCSAGFESEAPTVSASPGAAEVRSAISDDCCPTGHDDCCPPDCGDCLLACCSGIVALAGAPALTINPHGDYPRRVPTYRCHLSSADAGGIDHPPKS
jgi:hypothetical protein